MYKKIDRKVVLDTETTGLSVDKGDRLVEIGCVEIINSLITENFFHCYINPERSISEGAYRVHGISLEKLKDKPTFNKIADDFLNFIQDSTLIIHNAKFDIGFLNAELSKAKKPLLNTKNVIDTLQVARSKFPDSHASLDALCKKFNISLENRKLHGALLDAQLLAKVYLELSYLEQMELFSRCTTFPSDDLYSEESKMKQINLVSRSYKISDEDLETHKKFLNKIKNPLWAEN